MPALVSPLTSSLGEKASASVARSAKLKKAELTNKNFASLPRPQFSAVWLRGAVRLCLDFY